MIARIQRVQPLLPCRKDQTTEARKDTIPAVTINVGGEKLGNINILPPLWC